LVTLSTCSLFDYRYGSRSITKMEIKIQEPWWGAWKFWGWADGIWGVSIAKHKVEEAIEKGEKIYLNIWKFKEQYVVSPVTVKNYAQKHHTQNLAGRNKKVLLYCIPQTILEKIK